MHCAAAGIGQYKKLYRIKAPELKEWVGCCVLLVRHLPASRVWYRLCTKSADRPGLLHLLSFNHSMHPSCRRGEL